MWVKALSAFVTGRATGEPGAVLELPDKKAAALIRRGLAEAVPVGKATTTARNVSAGATATATAQAPAPKKKAGGSRGKKGP